MLFNINIGCLIFYKGDINKGCLIFCVGDINKGCLIFCRGYKQRLFNIV